MKIVKAFRFGTLAFQVLTLIVLGLTLHTVFSVLSNAMIGNTFKLDTQIDQSTGDRKLTLNARPTNGGFLGANMYLELGVLNEDGEYVTRNSTSAYLGSGEQRTLALNLVITKDEALKYNITEGSGFLEITFRIRTLADLVGFQNTMKVKAG